MTKARLYSLLSIIVTIAVAYGIWNYRINTPQRRMQRALALDRDGNHLEAIQQMEELAEKYRAVEGLLPMIYLKASRQQRPTNPSLAEELSEKAVALVTRAVEQAPFSGARLLTAAKVFQEVGDMEQAVRYYRLCIKVNEENLTAVQEDRPNVQGVRHDQRLRPQLEQEFRRQIAVSRGHVAAWEREQGESE